MLTTVRMFLGGRPWPETGSELLLLAAVALCGYLLGALIEFRKARRVLKHLREVFDDRV